MKQVFTLFVMALFLFSGMGYVKADSLFIENFEDNGTSLPADWTQLAIRGSNRWTCIEDADAPSPNHALRHMSGNSSSALITPAITIPETGNYELTFAFKTGSFINPASHKVMISTTGNDDIAKFEDLFVLLNESQHLLLDWSTEPIIASLEAYSGQTVHIAFVYNGGAGATAWFIDDVEVREPQEPSISEFPWTEGFENNGTSLPADWTQIAIRGNNRWTCIEDADAPSPNHALRHMSGNSSSALITPAITIPDTDEYELTFAFKTGSFINPASHKVMISTTGNDDIAKFEDLFVLLNESQHLLLDWSTAPIKASLEEYSGQTVHIAFVYNGGAGATAWFIDDVAIKKKSNASITEFPWVEGFEDNGTNLPVGWSQEVIVGDPNHPFWEVVSRGFGDVTEPHSGTYMVRFFGLQGRHSKLYTPSFDLTALHNPRLKFWHRQQSDGGNRETFTIYYKTSADGEWIELKQYRGSSAANWAERAVALPNPSDEYYLMFDGLSGYGRGIHLDDLVIETTPNIPILSAESTLAFGNVYNNLPITPSQTYTIFNMGGADLTISAPTSVSPELTVTGLPLTIGAMETATFSVTINSSGLPEGAYNGNIVFTTNDEETPEFTVNVTAGILSANVSSYVMETFNTAMPTGWTWSGVYVVGRVEDEGLDGSPCLRANLYVDYPQLVATTTYVEMGPNPEMSYFFKAINYGDGNVPTSANDLRYSVLISKDFGRTYEEVLAVSEGEHVPSSDFARVDVDVSAYANEFCLVQIVYWSIGSAADYFLYIDDISIGTQRTKELAAASIAGNVAPTVHVATNYTISVQNLGTETQTNYSVKLMQRSETGDNEIASLPGVAIASDETKEFVFSWTPTAEETVQFYGEVVLAGDEFIDNNKTSVLSINVQPAENIGVSIGDGTEKYRIPYNTFYSMSLSQTLYYPHELGVNSGEIRSIVYKADYVYTGNKLENVPIQIWIGETTREDLEDGWVSPAGFTEVFDGTISLTAGVYDVTVQFDTPYEYNGGILVVHSFKKNSDSSNTNDGFLGTEDLKSYRSLLYNSFATGINPNNPEQYLDATIIHGFPNTTFVLNTEGNGSLSGVVNNGMMPIEGAIIQVAGTRLYTLTDAAGNYQLPSLAPGSYNIEVIKHGYATQILDITIEANVPLVRNVTLVPLSTHTVSGRVIGSNAPNGIESVEVSLSGYESYAAYTDASGNYSIPNVYGNITYTINAKSAGYIVHSSSIDIATSDATRDITLVEKAFPVLNMVAMVEDNQAIINWDAPVSTSLFSYDNGICTGQLGFQADFQSYYPRGIIGSCHRTNAVLENISWYLTDVVDRHPTTVNIYIFELDNLGKPTSNVIFSALEVPSTKLEWNTYQFPEYVEAPHGFFMTLAHPDTYLAIGLSDPDAEHPFLAQTHFYNSDFELYAPVALDGSIYEKNVMIRAEGLISGEIAEFGHPAPKNQNPISGNNGEEAVFISSGAKKTETLASRANYSPTPIGYIVYRLMEDESESSWVKIDTTTDTGYTDTDWSTLPEGTYQYAIKAEYIDDNISKGRLTNTLINDGVGIGNLLSGIKVYSHSNNIYVMNESNIDLNAIQVMDMKGQVVYETKATGYDVYNVNVATGYYVVRLISEDGAILAVKLYLTASQTK